MIDISQCNLGTVSVHKVGNRFEETGISLSENPLEISDPELKTLLLEYFTTGFRPEELFEFTFSNHDHSHNPVFSILKKVFEDKSTLHQYSRELADFLYKCSNHPMIKEGDFYMAYFSNLLFGDETLDGIGIFKIESVVKYLKLDTSGNTFQVGFDSGADSRKLDKGCLVFNMDSESGFKMCLIDNSSRQSEAAFWKESFLNVRPASTGYHQTNNFLSITKDFVSKQLPQEMEIDKADQVDLLNKSMDFFKEREQFDREEFMDKVFQHPQLIDSFQQFENQISEEQDLSMPNQFNISQNAVKKKARVFKSVLKLDKNFHVYIHGNRELIEKGVDPESGKKFYKIYYDQEN
ncbi:MAG: nucleoid-associated protein [Bacteroidota bacterium]